MVGEMPQVAVIGGGVVGAAVAHALARRDVTSVLLEAEEALALGASGTNSGILHTGFDSVPGELETRLILRSAQLRASIDVPVLPCGAVMKDAPAAVIERARANGVEVVVRPDGALEVPGESVTDPVAYTLALASAAEEVRVGARVETIRRKGDELLLGLAGGDEVACEVAVNCAGLHADDVARLAGDDSFEIYPRKGEFFVFDPPEPLEHILLPAPTDRTKGVLVFPTIDGMVVAGPTAHDQADKSDWSVREEARHEVTGKARAMWPPLEGAEPVASYAGLRPAGRGVNYAIGPSPACRGLITVAAIRSTGLSASLGIGEHVVGLVAEHGVQLGSERPVPVHAPASAGRWWQRRAAVAR